MANTITDTQIEKLSTEAGEHGDLEQVALCQRALAGDAAARGTCERVVVDAALNAIDPDDLREFEAAALSIGDEFLPECARIARDTHKSSPEYRAWLVQQYTSRDEGS